MKKQILGLFLCLAMILTFAPQAAFASEPSEPAIIDSGMCGANIMWKLYDEGTLTIDGCGEMTEWPSYRNDEKYRNIIKKAVISEGVTNVGPEAFLYCKNLESVTIPKSVTRIDDQAFCECVSLKDVNIPADVTIIGEYGFFNCRSLESITIPAKVERIGDMAFGNCSALKSIIFADSTPPAIDGYAFYEDKAMAYYPANNKTWKDAIDNGYRTGYGGDLTWEASHLMHAKGVWPGYDATCTKDGLTDGVICLTCHGDVVEKREVIPHTGHKGKWMGNSRDATCSQTGIKEGVVCKICGWEMVEAEELPINPNNHKNIVTDKSVKATSTKTGLTAGSHCKDCGKVIKKQTLTLAKPVLTSGTKNIATRKIVVKWKKNSTCTGYQVKYVTGSTTKTVKVSGKSTLSKTLRSLKKGKTYKVYVRCYKTVGSKTYYSPYSTYKKVKVVK